MFVLSIISCCVNGSRLEFIALVALPDFFVLVTCLSYIEHSFCICHPFKLEVHPALFPSFYSLSSSSCTCLFSSRDAQPFSPIAVNHLFSPGPSQERECSEKVVYAKCSSSPSLFEPGQPWTAWFAVPKVRSAFGGTEVDSLVYLDSFFSPQLLPLCAYSCEI